MWTVTDPLGNRIQLTRRCWEHHILDHYADCYYCGGERLEREVDLDFRWRSRLYVIERAPVGVCQQCGEKFLTAAVSEELDRRVKSAKINRTVEVPVKMFQRAVA